MMDRLQIAKSYNSYLFVICFLVLGIFLQLQMTVAFEDCR